MGQPTNYFEQETEERSIKFNLIWIIGGVQETAAFIEKLKPHWNYLVSVATEVGKEFLSVKNVVVSRMDVSEMLTFMRKQQVQVCVDLSHPYAQEVTQNAKLACEQLRVHYLRYLRPKTSTQNVNYFNALTECLDYLKTIKGCVFFTTGSKNIAEFEKVRGANRFVYRVLPAQPSLDACQKNQVATKDIVAILGPLSEELNMAMFREYQADYVVMKDSGPQGGTLEKIAACHQLNIPALLIGRAPQEEGLADLEQVVQQVHQLLERDA
ncbi:precorrin-6A reductase [Deltaproteobacteria bacterium TL4]